MATVDLVVKNGRLVLPGGDRQDRGSVRVRFFPDGGGEAAEISVTAQDGGALRVTVDPLTGLAEAGI